MSGLKIGRNDPCPCGSGKKYKNCCMNKTQPGRSDSLYRKLGEVRDRLVYKLLNHAKGLIGQNVLFVAWEEFILDGDEEYNPDTLYSQLFYPWLLYTWVPQREDYLRGEDGANLAGMTIAETFAKRYDYKLSAMELRLIDIAIHQPYSFYEILECNPGENFLLKDINLGSEVLVMEKSGSRMAKKHGIVFGQVIQYESVGMLLSTGAYYFPSSYKIDVINLRASMLKDSNPLSVDDLFSWEADLRSLYFRLHKRVSSPPTVHNTDGDPLVLHKLLYEIDSPEEVFPLLRPLSLDKNDDDILAEAEYDRNGKLSRIEFPWLKKGNEKMKSWENTVLGHITLDKNQLIVDVNSANRAKMIKEKIRSLLGTKAIYQETKINFVESAMDRAKKSGAAKTKSGNDELMNKPEMRAAIENHLEKHWQSWIYEKIPALNNVAPIDAVKDPDGLEKVEALLTDIEMHDQNAPPHMKQKKYIDETRKRLGI